jgi:hypothetical protein
MAGMEEIRYADRKLVRKPDGKRRLGKPKHRWENNNNSNRQEKVLGRVG